MTKRISGRVSVSESAGYHLASIPRGVYGEASKIYEEVAEFKDACEQGLRVMELAELSDVMGAVRGYLAKHWPGIALSDLERMALVTERAFKSGQRKVKDS